MTKSTREIKVAHGLGLRPSVTPPKAPKSHAGIRANDRIPLPEGVRKGWAGFRASVFTGTVSDQITIIRAGVPARVLQGMADDFQISRENACQMLGVSSSTAKRKLATDATLDSAVTERLVRVASVQGRAEEVFGERQLAQEWLRTANLALGSSTPLSMLDTDLGAREVLRLLSSIAYGGVA